MKLTVNSLQPKTVFFLPAAALLSMVAMTTPAGALTPTDTQGAAHVSKMARQDRIEA